MKKYIKEIEISGIIMMIIGVALYHFFHKQAGYIACCIGIALWLIEVVYKAFNWKEYHKDNMQNVMMMLIIIMLLISYMLFAR
jgi:uncharacterized membrane protein HdeD (DUF308 family)